MWRSTTETIVEDFQLDGSWASVRPHAQAMIELVAYVVSGLKSLAEIERVPVRKPTIITGANEGGKTS